MSSVQYINDLILKVNITVNKCPTPRVEYDAYRTDLEELSLTPRDASTTPKMELSQQQFQVHREKYERMRSDVSVKLKFLEENKVSRKRILVVGLVKSSCFLLTARCLPTQVKVLHNQLILFHNAIAAYYAGNQQQLEETLKQFHIKLKVPGVESPSWLEEH